MKRFIISAIYPLFFIFVRFLLLFRGLYDFFISIWNYFYTEWKRSEFKDCSSMFNEGGIIMPHIRVVGGKYITIGNKTYIGKNSILSARDKYGDQVFTPSITIGSGCGLGEYTHITAVNKIIIGNGVLLGNYVIITDNAHGGGDLLENQTALPPIDRPIYSKGPVVIGDNVWIGEKVAILPGVIIGNGAIIGANSVVTKDIPAYAVVAGSPARIVRMIK
jgi:acetyltransferase-like isoleucine patch superfamily enzyme